jgi:hypothetical protein
MITVAKHAIILVIIRSLATPYAGPHKLFKMFLKLPRCSTLAHSIPAFCCYLFECERAEMFYYYGAFWASLILSFGVRHSHPSALKVKTVLLWSC